MAAGAGLLEEAARLVELGRELQDAAAAHLSKSCAEEQAACSRAAALEAGLRGLQASVQAAQRRGEVDAKEADKVRRT